MVPHDSRIRALANVLEGLQQDRVCHIAAEIAHKDVKVGGSVALLFLEGPLDAHFLWKEGSRSVAGRGADGKQCLPKMRF